MRKAKQGQSRATTIIIACAITLAVIFGGWQIYRIVSFYLGAEEFISDASQKMEEVDSFWREFESKPRSFYTQLDYDCRQLIESYASYTDYPYSIPIDDNPTVPAAVLEMGPEVITVWSRDHMSITVVSIAEGMGFHVTWKREPDGSVEIFFGGSPEEGSPVYTSQDA